MVRIEIDGVKFEVAEGKNLLETCQSLGINVPYYCWHPALDSVGACRQCAVKQYRDENDTRGRIVMSCMTPVVDGLRISVTDPEAVEFRRSVGEWLMLNHPHDCPICDEGGECHLQDMIVMIGHNYRRTAFPKRTYHNQNLGPFIHQEMNRCIQCYRCVRFYKDYAGGDDFDALASQDSVFFGRAQSGTLESPFSGNLVEVCPTGVFTDKTYKQHSIRKWDLQQAPSICTGCSLGCNTFVSERYGMVRRIRNRYSSHINGYFLCDRGRFGYEQVNSEDRLRESLPAASREEAIAHAKSLIAGAGDIIGIGSPRASVESNFMLRKLVGKENFYAGVNDREEVLVELVHAILRDGPVATASLKEVERCDAVLLLGEDPVNSAPMLELALRQAARVAPAQAGLARTGAPSWDDRALRMVVQEQKGPIYAVTVYPTSVDRFAAGHAHLAPDDIARFAAAVTHFLDNAAPEVKGLDSSTVALAERAAEALRSAERPLLISGTSALSRAVIENAANIARALKKQGRDVRQFYVLPEQNSMGLAMLSPHLFSEAVERARAGKAGLTVVLENDLARRCAEPDAEAILTAAPLLALDSFSNGTTRKAALILPASSFAEATGTVVNNEGRAQRFFRAMEPTGTVQESWKWLVELLETGAAAGAAIRNLDDLLSEIEAAEPAFSGIKQAAPGPGRGAPPVGIPRQSFRWSGRTSIHASEDVREHRVHADPDSPLRYSMEGRVDPVRPGLIPEYWVPGWNSVQALNRFQEEVGGALRGGEPGLLLFGRAAATTGTPAAPEAVGYFQNIPAPFVPAGNRYLALPYARIFGAEELSSRSPAIIARAEQPYAGLSAQEAEAHGLRDGAMVRVRVDGESEARELRLRHIPELPAGIVLLPAGSDNWNAGRVGPAVVEGRDS
ncbi:MAG TPA: NADH-quinone oxidoreductase subunit NuoG [Spirochaetia bacterium]|nr:NADH-quinone oxidoreductase subunit NuoG [Spirochaetia bacterium]